MEVKINRNSTSRPSIWRPRVCLRLLQDTDSSSAIKEMQRGLDENNDGKVSFQEYLTLIGYVASALSDRKIAEQKGDSNADAP